MVDAEVVRTNLAEARAAVDEAAATAGRRAGSVAILAAVKYVTRDDLQAIAEAGVDAGRREPHRCADRQAGRLRATPSAGTSSATSRAARRATWSAASSSSTRCRPSRPRAQIDARSRAPAGRAGRGQHRRRPGQGGRLAGRRWTRSSSCSPASRQGARPRPDDDAAVRRGSRGVAAGRSRALRELARPATERLGRHARVRRALDGHQPGLRRGGRPRARRSCASAACSTADVRRSDRPVLYTGAAWAFVISGTARWSTSGWQRTSRITTTTRRSPLRNGGSRPHVPRAQQRPPGR